MKISITKVVSITIVVIFLVATLIPFMWMVFSSLKPEEEIYRTNPTWVPETFTLAHYGSLFTQFHFGRYVINTVMIAVGTTILSVILGVLAAYGFSRYSFRGSGTILFMLILTRLFTPVALVVPLYTLMNVIGLADSVIGIIIGVTIVNLPFVVWIMKAFFDALPVEVEDAAKVDGMSPFRALWKVVLPMAMPAIITVALFSFIYGWIDFLFGLSLSRTASSMPATVGIASMLTGYKVYWGALMAGGTFLSIPILILAFIFQKYLVRGLTTGAIK